MDDLISRKAAIESIDKKIEAICEENELTDYQKETASMCREWFVDEVAHIPAVPLDKLCEWLADYMFTNDCAKDDMMETPDFWREKITKWMEKQNAAN